jgi:hypothetical protein
MIFVALMALGVTVSGCGRTGLTAEDLDEDIEVPASVDSGLDGAKPDTNPPPPSSCTPSPEVCNGKDDDCNGLVDDGLASIPCSGGGFRYCVAGRMSDCPTRCEVCMPGSSRACFLSYCKYWGTQTCAADGRTFGYCAEDTPPPECKAIADTNKYSRELEQCCLDNGYCCRDDFDLNKNGITNEHIGRCEAVTCK